MFHKILVALDTPEHSEQVIEAVYQLQLSPNTAIVLAHVIVLDDAAHEQPADRPQIDPELGPFRHMEKQLQEYQRQLPYASTLEIVTGDPAEEIVRLANIHQAQLIVIGSRGLLGVDRILQGSVSSQVVNDAPCSVLVIKSYPAVPD